MQTRCSLTTRDPDRKRRQDDIKRAQAAAKQAAFRKQVKADMARDRQLRREARQTSAARRRKEQEKERTELIHKATVRVNGCRCTFLCVKGNTFTLLCGVCLLQVDADVRAFDEEQRRAQRERVDAANRLQARSEALERAVRKKEQLEMDAQVCVAWLKVSVSHQ